MIPIQYTKTSGVVNYLCTAVFSFEFLYLSSYFHIQIIVNIVLCYTRASLELLNLYHSILSLYLCVIK